MIELDLTDYKPTRKGRPGMCKIVCVETGEVFPSVRNFWIEYAVPMAYKTLQKHILRACETGEKLFGYHWRKV